LFQTLTHREHQKQEVFVLKLLFDELGLLHSENRKGEEAEQEDFKNQCIIREPEESGYSIQTGGDTSKKLCESHSLAAKKEDLKGQRTGTGHGFHTMTLL
jgi:hypothetical protein